MAEICRGVVSDRKTSRRRMEMRRFKFVAEVASETEDGGKRRKIEVCFISLPSDVCGEYGEDFAMKKNEENNIIMNVQTETL
ncbi:hypothetical protein M5689_013840 [Euphorbia peplus]|nr:hypothetical protein M5689_013840 [Euphorbia peplus]